MTEKLRQSEIYRKMLAGRWGTTVGMKVLMAATGVVMVAFLIFHLAGNLVVYDGLGAFNAYAALLHREPMLLWLARAVLLVSVVLHIAAAVLLWRLDVRASGVLPPPSPAVRHASLSDDAIERRGTCGVHRVPPPPPHDRDHPARTVRRKRHVPKRVRPAKAGMNSG
jgi:succinate dehydrogenase/fumarate reductase cytochrome b subunit